MLDEISFHAIRGKPGGKWLSQGRISCFLLFTQTRGCNQVSDGFIEFPDEILMTCADKTETDIVCLVFKHLRDLIHVAWKVNGRLF